MYFNTEEEVWKEIKGFEDSYLISNHGRVYSLITRKQRKIQVRKPDGYNMVSLWKNNRGVNCYVHRLVLQHFSESPEDETVNHKDGNKSNNHISNLEWMSYAENNRHAVDTGLNSSKNKRNKKGSMPVSQFSLDGRLIKTYPSMRQAERETGVTATEIGHGIRKGWKYGGYIWKFAN